LETLVSIFEPVHIPSERQCQELVSQGANSNITGPSSAEFGFVVKLAAKSKGHNNSYFHNKPKLIVWCWYLLALAAQYISSSTGNWRREVVCFLHLLRHPVGKQITLN